MAEPSTADRLLYQTRMQRSARDLIVELAGASWATGQTTLSIAGAIQAVWAARAGASVGLLSKLSIYTLPITTFMFGAWLRDKIDDEDGKKTYEHARFLILDLSIQNVTDIHFRLYPNSLLRNDSAVHHLRVPSDNYHKTFVSTWGLAYKKWWDRLGDRLEDFRVLGHMTDITDTWKDYVLSSFNEITQEFLSYLATEETHGGFGNRPHALSDEQARTFGQ